MGGIELKEARILERGMAYDRRWMLVDRHGEFISQRNDTRLSLFTCKLDDQLVVSYGDRNIVISKEEHSDVRILTTVWEHEVYAYEVSEAASLWFSTILEIECRLVKMTNTDIRFKKLLKGPDQTKVSFADGYPYLILGTASLELLSEVVGSPISKDRFRPNIVVATSVAHEEDDWNVIQVGSARLQVIKPCARCIVVNIDQSSSTITKEPLKSLATYRMVDNNVNFGANTICLDIGKIKVGDILNRVE